MRDLRDAHGAKRLLLQVRQLRKHKRVLLSGSGTSRNRSTSVLTALMVAYGTDDRRSQCILEFH